jgi:hypothetical protein
MKKEKKTGKKIEKEKMKHSEKGDGEKRIEWDWGRNMHRHLLR